MAPTTENPVSLQLSPEGLRALLLQISQDADEHGLTNAEVEAVWAMGLSSFLTARGHGVIGE